MTDSCVEFHCISGDGAVQLVDPLNLQKISQLTGADADAIYRVCCYGDTVYSSCRDGVIRKHVIR